MIGYWNLEVKGADTFNAKMIEKGKTLSSDIVVAELKQQTIGEGETAKTYYHLSIPGIPASTEVYSDIANNPMKPQE